MIQHIYTEDTLNQNISFGIFNRRIFDNRKDLRDLSNHTVIVVTDEIIDETLIKEIADVVLKKGCKNVAFCGTASDEWQRVFDEADREINGFNDLTGYEDFAVMWRFEDIDSLADEVYTCWNEVLILCSNMSLIKECRDILSEA